MWHVEWQKSLGVLMAEEVGNKMLDGKNAGLRTKAAVHALPCGFPPIHGRGARLYWLDELVRNPHAFKALHQGVQLEIPDIDSHKAHARSS